jgi:hypothetical protein
MVDIAEPPRCPAAIIGRRDVKAVLTMAHDVFISHAHADKPAADAACAALVLKVVLDLVDDADDADDHHSAQC